MSAAPMIEREIAYDIVDTRDRDQSTREAMPETGNPIPCECCGRQIVIHVYTAQAVAIRNDFGTITGWLAKSATRRVIGQTCAKRAKVAMEMPRWGERLPRRLGKVRWDV